MLLDKIRQLPVAIGYKGKYAITVDLVDPVNESIGILLNEGFTPQYGDFL
jgi:hypothetical protein